MKLTITINNVQHIIQQKVSFDLSKNGITCITGKNGVGKTTLIRAVRNLVINSTFQETSAPYIFKSNSSIVYSIGGLNEDIVFTYNRFIKSIDSKQDIPSFLKSSLSVELPIPHGERFNHFRKLAVIDEELRTKIAIGEYEKPDELISFLERVYDDQRFENLKKVDLKKTICYFVLKDEKERFYIREDYFSSGEYFIVNLYKQIQQRKKLIVIDEIDISLDASAQVNLVKILKEYCKRYEINIVFTTHSLALIKTLDDDELYYMERETEDGNELISIHPRSYNFVKSIMYGFRGFDKYILTEDKRLAHYINHLILSSGINSFFKHTVIDIGGATQVIDLMKRNNDVNFLTEKENTLSVLDGDQKGKGYLNGVNNVVLLPFWSIEVELYRRYKAGDIHFPKLKPIINKSESDRAKRFYEQLIHKKYKQDPLMSEEEIYAYLEELNPDGVRDFQQQLLSFLSINSI